MTYAARSHAATVEREDPRNRLLDAFDATLEALRDQGLEEQLRARFARLLPPQADSRQLELSIVLTALTLPPRARRTEAEFAANRRAREIVTSLMRAA